MTEAAGVTVVIPTAGRGNLVRACIESIQQAAAADDVRVEIVLVDSSSASERSELQAFCSSRGVRLIRGPVSVSEKRNLGAQQAGHQHVMFIDSDCVMCSGCLAAHLATLTSPSFHASQGTVLFRGPESLAFRVVRHSGLLDAFHPEQRQPVRAVAAGNLMVRRSSFLAVGFDPRLGPPGLGGEDVDFGLRLTQQGYSVVGTPAALVFHETITWNGLFMNARRFFSWGRAEAHLIKRHPHHSYLDMPSPAITLLLLALLSLFGAWWSPTALLTVVFGLLCYTSIMAIAGMWRYPSDRLAGAVAHSVFFVLDFGRIWESLWLGRPSIAPRRLYFSEDQASREWPDLVLASWAGWFTVLAAMVFFWWSIRLG